MVSDLEFLVRVIVYSYGLDREVEWSRDSVLIHRLDAEAAAMIMDDITYHDWIVAPSDAT